MVLLEKKFQLRIRILKPAPMEKKTENMRLEPLLSAFFEKRITFENVWSGKSEHIDLHPFGEF